MSAAAGGGRTFVLLQKRATGRGSPRGRHDGVAVAINTDTDTDTDTDLDIGIGVWMMALVWDWQWWFFTGAAAA